MDGSLAWWLGFTAPIEKAGVSTTGGAMHLASVPHPQIVAVASTVLADARLLTS